MGPAFSGRRAWLECIGPLVRVYVTVLDDLEFTSTAWVIGAAALAPWLSQRGASARVPVIALELLLGVAIGPHGLQLAEIDGGLQVLALMGMALLFFLAGMEIDVRGLRGPWLARGVGSWAISLGLAAVAAWGLGGAGVIADRHVVAIALATTALGIVAPVLRDMQCGASDFARAVIACAVMGELGPVLLMSLLFAGRGGEARQIGATLVFMLAALAVCWASLRVRPPGLIREIGRAMHRSGQWPIRLCLLLMVAMMGLAHWLRLELALGALVAGLVVGLARREQRGAPLDDELGHKLDAVGFGLLVPIFFVTSGMRLEVRPLMADAASWPEVVLLGVALLAVRGLPAVLFVRDLGVRQTQALALLSATSLSMIVALSSAAVAAGHMAALEATRLVAAGLLSVLLFPWLATCRLSPGRDRAAATITPGPDGETGRRSGLDSS